MDEKEYTIPIITKSRLEPPRGTNLLKTMWEKEKMLVTSISLVFPQCLLLLWKKKIYLMSQLIFLSADVFNFAQSRILFYGKE